MNYPIITKKKLPNPSIKPNLDNYEKTFQGFSWSDARGGLDWFDANHVNMGYIVTDAQVKKGLGNKKALIWEGKKGEKEEYTFSELSSLSNRFANVLERMGIKKGDRVFFFLDRVPEVFIGIVGTLKAGAVAGPLFSAFGPDAVRDRLEDSGAKMLVTSPQLKKKIENIFSDLPSLEKIIIVSNRGEEPAESTKILSYKKLMGEASDQFTAVKTDKDDASIMHYTSGTTGRPKGAVHAHEAILGHYVTGKYVLDFHENDFYWCTADPGWVTGTSYGIFAPWSHGVTQYVCEGGFSAKKWYDIIQKNGITIWYTAPTAIRMLMKAGDELPRQFDFSSLRHILSVGEPLNPEALLWGHRTFGQPFHDTWWQTETGAMMIVNYPIMDIKPGSMGRPLPGICAGIIDDDGNELGENREGHLALKTPWPSLFRTYWNKEEMYHSRFKNGWYITGDKAKRDEDGYYWFIGRADDVINTAGHLVGPFEVESVLIEHPSVAEAGVIGKPDPVAMEIIKAFVSLREGIEPSDTLKHEIQKFVMKRLSSAATPREIDFLPSLPKTRSGKIMRRLLKARELGLPTGDTSTLEDD